MTDVKVEGSVRGQNGGLESAACFQTQPISEGRLVLCSAGVSKNGGGRFCVHIYVLATEHCIESGMWHVIC